MRILFPLLTLLPLSVMAQSSLENQLQRAAAKRVFFAHQSVGQNVLDGLAALAKEGHVAWRIEENGALTAPGLGHARVGENGKPAGKLEAFPALLATGPGKGAELALVKLCYVDFSADTDAAALFARYQAMVKQVEASAPGVRLVHVTAPLTTVQTGLKGWLKNTVGSGAYGERENVKRHEYNQALRAAYGAGLLFDLAQVEAGEGGGACRFTREGRSYPCLRPELTDDGGHLNAKGQQEAARALLEVLAR